MSDRITPRLENQGRNGGISGAGKVIHNFIKNKDLTSLEWTLQFKEAQKEINFRNKKGLTPLMVAASQCDWDNCLLLLRYKPEFLPRKCQAAQAPWLLAREHGDHKLAAYLLSAYNDETLNGLTKNFGSQLIHERCSKKKDKFDESDMEELKWLFSQFGGALVNYTDAVMRDAPIISVLRAENDELAEYMLRECSVHLLTQDVSEFKSILHIAIQKELQVRYLITEQEPQVLLLIDQDKRSPFFLACMKGDSEYIQWVFHKFMSGDRYIYSPLSEGAVVDDIGRVATSPVLKVSTPSFVKEDDSMSNPEGEGNKGSKEKKESLLGESGEETDGSIELHHVSVEVGRDDVVDGEPMWKTMSMSSSVSSSVSRFSEVTESMSIANRDVNEDSVFHILARQGNHELMDFIFFNGRTFDRNMSPDVFLQPCGHTKGEYTPVQLAIQENHAQCLQVMLGYIMEQLVRTKDEDLIKRITDLQLLREAICNGSIGSVKVVICFGLWYEELDDASLYSLCNRQSTELLFLLVSLYAARNVIKSRINKSSDLLTGTIKWSDLYICNLHPLLLPIASNVIHQCERYLVEWTSLQTGSSQENASPQQDRAFLQQIGKMCLATVEEQFVPSPVQSSSFSRIVSVPRKWRVEEFTTLIHITHFDLANNELHQIPIEVFLLPSLEELNLSNNQLKELPSVSPPVQNVGQRPTYQSHCLKVLNLSNNHLCFLPPQLFTLGQLEELDASHNELHYLPLLLWLPSKLKTLTLHHNQLTQLHCLSHELLVNSKSFIKTAQSCWYNQVEDCTDSDDDLLLSSMYEGHFEDTWDYCGSSPVRQVSTDLKDLTDIKKEELRSLLDFIREKFRTIEEVNDLELEPQSSREPQTPQVETLQNWFRHSKIWSPRSPTGTLKRSTEESSTQDHVDSSRELSEATPQNSSEPGDPYHQPSTLDLIEEENLPLNSLSTLDLSYNHFTVFPWDLPCLAPSLVRVNLSHNKISATNLVRDFPDNVKKIVLSNCELRSVMVEKDEDQPNLCGHLITQILGSIFKENWTSDCCVHRKYPSLPHLSLLDLSNNNCDFLPLSPSDIPQAKDGVKAGKNKSDSTYFPSLSTLILNGNSPMRTISRSICKLPFLTKLDISHTSVDSFPSELGLCPKLLVLNAEGIPSVKGDLQSFLVNNDTGGLVSYLKSLHQDSRPYHAIKLMVVGDTAKGKTTLVGNLAKKCPIRRQKDLRVGLDGAPLSTEGVDILDWEYPSKSTKARPTVRFYTWDFGGQVCSKSGERHVLFM
jgi:Leucine-rich repeat (LRR) protein